jgi:hypothetical protein
MVNLSDNQRLGDTKPHHLPEHENAPQPIKPVDNSEEQDSQFDTVIAPSVSAAKNAASPNKQTNGSTIEQTQPIFDDAAEERLMVLSRVLVQSPQHPQARRRLYETLQRYLQHNPFLRYLEENDSLYQVITGGGRVVIVPKDRAVTPPYPSPSITSLQRAYRWLGYALIGLLLAGLGAFICAPIAGMFAWRASLNSPDSDQRRRAGVALIYAGVLWAIGLIFSFLFLLHL